MGFALDSQEPVETNSVVGPEVQWSQSVLGDRLGHVKDFSREDPLARAYRNKNAKAGRVHAPADRE